MNSHPFRPAFALALLLAAATPAAAQLLTVGASPRTLGTNRENFETPHYRIGNFGWFSFTMTEQHPAYRYPTPADLNPAGWFTTVPHDLARADFNGDGREDLVVTCATFPHTVPRQARFTFAVLLNDGQGGYRYAPDIWGPEGAPAGCVERPARSADDQQVVRDESRQSPDLG